jgi:CheY-like chemotaxis protein
MSEEFLPHIFEEFSRENNTTDNKIEGTGLGMPIVRRLVDFMQGSIRVSSRKGEGSTFVVSIPHRIATREDLVDRSAVKLDPEAFKDKRILLAEDNDLNAEIATEILKEAGFQVERAEDGQACIDMLEAAEPLHFDLILMDVQMPNKNGYEATMEIRRLWNPQKAGIPILAMTANAYEEDRREAYRCGMNGHLAKPIDVRELMKTLASILK